MRRWTVGRRITSGYAVLLVLLLVVVVVGALALTDTRDKYRSAVRAQEGAVRQLEAGRAPDIAFLSFLRFIVVKDPKYLKERKQAVAEARRTMTELSKTAPTAELRAGWSNALRLLNTNDAATTKLIAASEAKPPKPKESQRIFLEEVLPSRDRLRTTVGRLVEASTTSAANAADTAGEESSRALWIMLSVAAIALALGAVLAWTLARSIVGRLRETVGTLSSVSAEILAATSQQAAGVAQEQTAVNETSTTVDEVRQTAMLASDKAKEVADAVRRTAETSQDGQRAVDKSVKAAQQAKAQMEGIAEQILALSGQGRAIGEIVVAVNELADQLNLLAVNAGIEAAKAGEAGKGFAVVAAEVKALAEQSRRATAEIREILNEIQHSTQAAVIAAEQGVKTSADGETVVSDAGEAIRVLTESLSASDRASQQILVSTQQQIAGVDQMAVAIENIHQASAQNMASTQQVEEAAKNLDRLAGRLVKLVAAKRRDGEGRDGNGRTGP
jgi:methyl-accepting chemotaxis protein